MKTKLIILVVFMVFAAITAKAQMVSIVLPDTSYSWNISANDTLYIQPDTSWTGTYNWYVYGDSIEVHTTIFDEIYPRDVWEYLVTTDASTLIILQAFEQIRLGK